MYKQGNAKGHNMEYKINSNNEICQINLFDKYTYVISLYF